MQDIDVHGEFENCAVTLLVMSKFLNLPGASRACVDFRDPTDLFRLKELLFWGVNNYHFIAPGN